MYTIIPTQGGYPGCIYTIIHTQGGKPGIYASLPSWEVYTLVYMPPYRPEECTPWYMPPYRIIVEFEINGQKRHQ